MSEEFKKETGLNASQKRCIIMKNKIQLKINSAVVEFTLPNRTKDREKIDSTLVTVSKIVEKWRIEKAIKLIYSKKLSLIEAAETTEVPSYILLNIMNQET